jgi:hypothetical protein
VSICGYLVFVIAIRGYDDRVSRKLMLDIELHADFALRN